MNEMIERLSPEVAEILRNDLIQKVGNALRFKRNSEQEKLDLDDFVSEVVQEENRHDSWATW